MLDSVLSVYTRAGDVVGFEKALSRFALGMYGLELVSYASTQQF